MGSRGRSPSRLGLCLDNGELPSASEFFENSENYVSNRRRKGRGELSPDIGEEEEELIRSRKNEHAKCTISRKSHNSRNYFSLANGLILILILLLCWTTCQVQGGFPGRGPPSSPRGPPLLPHHPLSGNPFNRRRPHPPPNRQHHHHHGPPPRGRHPIPHHHPKSGRRGHPHGGNGDLSVAAQTLYDLRGYQGFPLTGPENPRYHRQNDPFTLPTPLAPNPRANGAHSHISQDTRTAPLVFPSFYQEQPTPAPARATIFGHNQHLTQSRFEPPAGFHLGGNSASGKITLEQQSASSRDQFRPSQIDISLHSNQVTPSPSPFGPQAQTSTLAPEKKSLASTNRPRATVKLNKNQQQDPFVYVYDEVDYDEGAEDDFVLQGRQRTPQGQINNNRITPSTSTTTVAPLRGREPTIVPNSNPFHNQFPALNYHQPQQLQQHHQALYTSTTTQPPPTTQNTLFYSPQKDDYRNPYYEPVGITRPPVTPRPNVEIVPSSERKPPPDQSNAISPALNRFPQSTIRDFNRPPQQLVGVSDVQDLRRRPPVTTTTTLPPPIPNVLAPQYQREAIFPHLQQYQQPQLQGRQVNPSPQPSPIPYFPPGLDRRPFETTNDIPSTQTKNQFDQVVNLLQEEEEEYSNNNAAQNLQDQSFNNPSKLRPVNTLIPKNRIPKEDFVLPPNFPFTHAQDVTTQLVPISPERNRGETAQQRLRDQTTRIREELPRVVPTQSQRPRPNVRPQDEELDEGIVNTQHHSQVTPSPARARGRQQQQQRTTTPVPVEVPQRTRNNSGRQRLRPNYRQSTTTSTTSTTPVPTYVEYPSQEYLDDYQDNQQYQQSPAPPAQVVSPVVPLVSKPISKFPPFPGKKTEVSTVPPTPLQRQRPTLAGRQRPGKGNRFRETSTLDSVTSPRTTGKPLYTTGKMLSKEGGLYAGQMITSSHVYGQPVPNVPINSVFDKMPGVLDGNSVFVATSKPTNFGSPQKQLRSKQRFPEHGPPSRVTSSSHRLRPTARPVNENGLDIVETVTLRPFSSEQDKSKEEPKRLRAGSQFVRGSNQQSSTERSQEEGQQVLPRRRKRPGQRRVLQQHQPEPFTETVNIHSSTKATEDEDVSSFQTERAQILRESPVTESTTANNVTPRSRRPRPRPGKLADLSNVSERSREREEDSQSRQIDEQPQKPLKPARKLRPRLRTVPVGQLNAQQQRGSPSEIVPQSQSAQVERKPTDAPGRFSSRFREQDNFDSSTVSTLKGDERETGSSTGPSRFSPPTSRPKFTPPPPKKTVRKRPQQQNPGDGDGDALPDSIKLSPKDVIANRKPARRIPPGSASDRLKALQQRRNKVFGQQHNGEAEQTAEGRQVPVSKRPRVMKPLVVVQEDALPQPQRLRRPNQASSEQNGAKREILSQSQQRGNKLKNEVDYYNEENEQNREDFEEENDEYNNDEPRFTSPSPQSQFIASVTSRPGRNNGGFHRNRSVEVTSDEARSVLGIPRPASPNRAPSGKRLRFQKKFQYDDEEVEEDGDNEEQQFQDSRPVLQNNPPRLKFRQNNNNNDRFREDEQEPTPSREVQTVLPQRPNKGGSRQTSKERVRQRPSQERIRQEELEEDDYRDVEEEIDDREEPPRKPFLKQNQRYNSNAPSSFQKIFRNKKGKSEQRDGNRSRQQVEDEEEAEDQEQIQDEQEDEITPSSERTTTTTSSSSTSTSSTSISTSSSSPSPPEEEDEESPVALPMRAGPQPIKMGMLKSRLRPNRRQKQQEVSVSVTTTEATITEERKPSGLKHGTINISKSLRPKLQGGGGGRRNSKKFIAMATENPSLPLESIFPEV